MIQQAKLQLNKSLKSEIAIKIIFNYQQNTLQIINFWSHNSFEVFFLFLFKIY